MWHISGFCVQFPQVSEWVSLHDLWQPEAGGGLPAAFQDETWDQMEHLGNLTIIHNHYKWCCLSNRSYLLPWLCIIGMLTPPLQWVRALGDPIRLERGVYSCHWLAAVSDVGGAKLKLCIEKQNKELKIAVGFGQKKVSNC